MGTGIAAFFNCGRVEIPIRNYTAINTDKTASTQSTSRDENARSTSSQSR